MSLLPNTEFNVSSNYNHAFISVHQLGEGAWKLGHYGYLTLYAPLQARMVVGFDKMVVILVVYNQRILEFETVPEILGGIESENLHDDWLISYQFSAAVQEEREVGYAIQELAHRIAMKFHEAYEALDSIDPFLELYPGPETPANHHDDINDELSLGSIQRTQWLNQGY